MHRTLVILFALITTQTLFAQSDAYRAQAYYYDAKQSYEAQNYSAAIGAIRKCKEILKGTNIELQYVHVLSAYYAGRYEEAQREMRTFFNIQEGKVEPSYFSNSVRRISQEEVLDITRLINEIDRKAEIQKTERLKSQATTSKQNELNRKLYEAPGKFMALLKDLEASHNFYQADNRKWRNYKYGYEGIKQSDRVIAFTERKTVSYKELGSDDRIDDKGFKEFLQDEFMHFDMITSVSFRSYSDIVANNVRYIPAKKFEYLRIVYNEDLSFRKYQPGEEKEIVRTNILTLDGDKETLESIRVLLQEIIDLQKELGK